MISLHHVTAEDADRAYHRNLLLMAREHERNATALARENDRLTLALTTRERELAEAHRENVALRAQVAQGARKQPPWYESTLAALWCALEALGERINRAWAHEGWGR